MSQPVTSSRLNNSSVNINGASAAVSTNFGLQRIGVTGNSFDISSSSGTVTLGITGTGNVQLGNATSGAVSFPGTTTFATLNSPAVGTNMSVGGNLTTGVLSLGSATSTTNLYGTLDVATIEGPTAGSAMSIGNNITAGSVSIGNAGGANTVTIGNAGAGATGTVNVGTSAATVNVGTVQPGTINIGVAGGGSTIINNISVLNGSTGGSNLTIGSNTTSGTVSIAGGSTFTGNIDIGAGGTVRAGLLRIGTGGPGAVSLGNVSAALTLTGSSIALSGTTSVTTLDASTVSSGMSIGDNLTSGTVSIGGNGSYTGNIDIAAGSLTRTGNINIGTGGSGPITIGNTTAPLSLRGSSTTFSSALTLGAAPTTSDQLGCIVTPSITWTANQTFTSASGIINEGSFTFSTIGTWIISFNLTVLVTTAPNAVGGIISNNGGISAPFLTTNIGVAPNITSFASGSYVCKITSSTTFTIFINIFSGSMYTNSGASTVIFTRIG